MHKRKLDRRAFVRTTGVGAGVTALLYACHAPGESWEFLTPREAEVLLAMIDRIIPSDEDPGAGDAGVIYYLDRQLVGPYARYQEAYRRGLTALQETSRATLNRSFQDLPPNDQTSLLEQLEEDRVPGVFWQGQKAPDFFGMVVDHTMQGFYGSPIHGGNKGFASYRMLGIELPIDYQEPGS